MSKGSVLSEAKKLYDLGFGIHWLYPKSKRPIESGWTSGLRDSWEHLEKTYSSGVNLGVRLGKASKVRNDFLGVIDVDVKSTDTRHAKEAIAALRLKRIEHGNLPQVKSGRGNGSRHYYILTPNPLTPFKAEQSKEIVKVLMPSASPSKRELKALTESELKKGIRLRPAWEISIMGEGQQVVLPPSIHPDSGKAYEWTTPFAVERAKAISAELLKKPENLKMHDLGGGGDRADIRPLEDFKLSPVDLSWLPVSNRIKEMIVTGAGVEDRSAMLLPVSQALFKAGLTKNEILTVLTAPKYFLGKAAYEHARTNSRERAAAWLFKYTVDKAIKAASAEVMFSSPIETPKEMPKEKVKEIQKQFDDEWDWTNDLDKTANDNIRGTLRNVVTILDRAVNPDLVKRDLFSYRDFYTVNTPWGGKKEDAVSDDAVKQTRYWLSENFRVEPTNNTISDALTVIALRNQFDPVLDYLESLPAWDKTPRLKMWLKNNFEAEGEEVYLSEVFTKWICAMVLRVYKPGIKFDWLPIFEGAQGIGKSSFGRLLCGDKYFLDWLPDLSNKDAALALQGVWVVEMGELASLRKNEIETVKAFITRTVDKIRPPYGQRNIESFRRCVFFGTTNRETYLRDDSGNRRFKPVKVGRLNFKALENDREQLFSEAKWLIENEIIHQNNLELSAASKVYEATIHGEKMVHDEADLMREKLVEFIEENDTKKFDEMFDFSRFKLSDLFSGKGSTFMASLPLKNWKFDARNAQFAAKALKSLGAENWKSEGLKYWKLNRSDK